MQNTRHKVKMRLVKYNVDLWPEREPEMQYSLENTHGKMIRWGLIDVSLTLPRYLTMLGTILATIRVDGFFKW